ncbi:putative LRR receptor-like serine/threonine-protein kinase At1g05700 [Bidens hawaiensis]|uniref:putative LRR receptor-like serine/threonine-protein kinase At1g05700 n=1 Tax=Bidens hawaiensis TaxID=980011 RepID=UPI004049D9EC
MALFKNLYSVLSIIQVALTLAMVHALDDQSVSIFVLYFFAGFISIDCGIPEGTKYTDNTSGINYVSDTGFIDSGINLEILSIYKYSNLDYQLNTVRSFPENTRNCYTLRPVQGKGNRYLIRARFMYGNHDFKGQPPQFDVYLGNDHWYKDDKYDRIWNPGYPSFEYTDVKVSRPNNLSIFTMENIPSKVLITAVTPTKETRPESSAFMRTGFWGGPYSDNDYDVMTWFIQFSGSLSHELKIHGTKRSTLPPMVNAIELFKLVHLQQGQTDDQCGKLAKAMWSIKSTYGLKRNWQGDPCVPRASIWDGINCSYNDTDNLRIISMNLSFSGLSGKIAPAFANLTMLQSLDLSYNNLTGSVPKFLASLNFLRILNLTGNNFARPLPAELLKKAKSGSLMLSIEADSDHCPKGSCKNNKHKKVVTIVIATIASLFLVLVVATVLWITKRRRTQDSSIRDEFNEPKNQRFTYSEVRRITDNFSSVIGKGGFGTVFSGLIGDTRAAVKMLSESSAQGYKEFQAEVSLLTSVHHKNITSLIGYCDEGSHKGLIYEYMSNGNLGNHLFGTNVLSLKERLQIGYDAAQGLEYMHHGCKPSIVHRDVKCSNILLNEKLQAKLADFGLSRAFTTEGATHVSTIIAGTPGYLDPEYFTTNRLTEKSDVYSFGVVLLELITGKPAISTDIYIVNWVKSMVEKGSVENIIDPRLHGDFDVNTAWKVVELAMSCVGTSSVERPTMNDVVMDLKNCLNGAKPNNLNHNMSLSLESIGGPNLR